MTDIQRLAKLLSQNHITQNEFESVKRDIATTKTANIYIAEAVEPKTQKSIKEIITQHPTIILGGIAVVLLLIILSSIFFFNRTETQAQEEAISNANIQSKEEIIILAKNGVMLRKIASVSGEEIVLMPSGAKVEIIEKTNMQNTFNGNTNYWYKVKYGNMEGYCFGGFTSVEGNTIDKIQKAQKESRVRFSGLFKSYNYNSDGKTEFVELETATEIYYYTSLDAKRIKLEILNSTQYSDSQYYRIRFPNASYIYELVFSEGKMVCKDDEANIQNYELIEANTSTNTQTTPSKAIYKANGKVYFYNDASYSSKRADYIVEGQKPMSLYKSGEFVYVTFTFNGNTTKGYLPIAELEFIAPVE